MPRKKPQDRTTEERKTIAERLEEAFRAAWDKYTMGYAPLYNPEGTQVLVDTEHERNWKFDCAWPDYKVAVELEGGVWMGFFGGKGKQVSRHLHPVGFLEDCMKYNRAANLGWVVLRYPADIIDTDPGFAVSQIITCLVSRGWTLSVDEPKARAWLIGILAVAQAGAPPELRFRQKQDKQKRAAKAKEKAKATRERNQGDPTIETQEVTPTKSPTRKRKIATKKDG